MKTHALTTTPLEKVRALLAIFLTAPLPILIHCFAGWDRTGEAGALYLLCNDNDTNTALSQLSPTFGHKKWLFPLKYRLITNFDKLYPNLLETMKKLCTRRLSYNELKDIKPEDLYFKLLEQKIGQTEENPASTTAASVSEKQ